MLVCKFKNISLILNYNGLKSKIKQLNKSYFTAINYLQEVQKLIKNI